MKRFKKLGWIFVTALIVYLVIYNFPWKHKINTTIQGIQCRNGNENYSENVSIKVKGVYKEYLIKNDTFEGTISIDNYDFTLDVPIMPTSFHDSLGNLTYYNNQNGFQDLGQLICTPDFDKLLITVGEPIAEDLKGWPGGNGLVICAPAKNRTEALEIAKILSSKSKWLSTNKWK